MGKTIGLAQLAQKKYSLVEGLPDEFMASFGKIEDSFDAIFYGSSGNGKSSCIAQFLKALIMAIKCKAEYVGYEEGHGFTAQELFITRYNLHELGNVMNLTDHLTYEELLKKMGRPKSPKIWVIDSLQASRLTFDQCDELKRKFVLSRKRKIIIYISWSEGKNPKGNTAKAVEYYANIKVRVQGFVSFIVSRYGGNKPFVIYEEGAKKYWAKKYKNIIK